MKDFRVISLLTLLVLIQSCGKSLKAVGVPPIVEVTDFAYGTSEVNVIYGTAIDPIAPLKQINVVRCKIEPLPLPNGIKFIENSCTLYGTPIRAEGSTAHLTGQFRISTFASVSATEPNSEVVIPFRFSQPIPKIDFGGVGNKNVDVDLLIPSNSSGGPITSCSVNPALPTGLAINQSTCVISGKVSQAVASLPYTVTAQGPGGSATSTFSLGLVFNAPIISYTNVQSKFIINSSAVSIIANKSGVHHCSITPALPAGLSFDTTSCAVSGTPTATAIEQTYTVKAFPGEGESSPVALANIRFEVSYNAPVLAYPAANSAVRLASYSLVPAAKIGTDHCTIEPALSAGLSFNTATCSISGTPTTIVSAKTFFITAFPGPGATAPTASANVTFGVGPTVGDTLNNNKCVNVSFNSRPSNDRVLMRIERDKYKDGDNFFPQYNTNGDSYWSLAEVEAMATASGVSSGNVKSAALDFYNDYNCDGLLGIDIDELERFRSETAIPL